MAGYSSTPLIEKLGIQVHMRVLTRNAPSAYATWLAPLPAGVRISARLRGPVDVAHLFSDQRSDLERWLPDAMDRVAPDGVVWVSWPKKASKVPTDITEDTVRPFADPPGRRAACVAVQPLATRSDGGCSRGSTPRSRKYSS